MITRVFPPRASVSRGGDRVDLQIFFGNRRGGVLFRFYTGSAPSFVSFCCNPFPFSSSTARIARSRRGEAIRGVGPLNGAGVKIRLLASDQDIAPEPTEVRPCYLVRCCLVLPWGARFCPRPRGARDVVEEKRPMPLGRTPQMFLHQSTLLGFRGTGRSTSISSYLFLFPSLA